MGEAIKEFWQNYASHIKNRTDLEAAKRALCKKYRLASILNSDLLSEYRRLVATGKPRAGILERILRKRSIRTLSGIAPVAVLTKAYPCPGSCAYCPHETAVPTSYLSNEPAVMRAIACGYDPYKQVSRRLQALENNGHEPVKIEIIVIGGTWSYLPRRYRYWYILNCFRAANDYRYGSDKSSPYRQSAKLEELRAALRREQRQNETAAHKIIGLTLETRPDYISESELREMRELGCTRVEIGVQAVDDEILRLNRRGHGVEEIAAATALLRRHGFKITYHLMPALPGATPAKDLALFKQLFTDSRFQPDQIKFYPTVVTRGSLLYRWYREGKYRPYADKVLQNLIIKCKAAVPPYVRIIRLIRDIPSESIVAGNKITNLRQIMKDRGVACQCIRCREAKEAVLGDYRINRLNYAAAGGIEYFISADSPDRQVLYGFARLRLDQSSPIAPALLRELHVYGELVPPSGAKRIQHGGLGKRLLATAEQIARQAGARRLAVISGVGVRQYYRKFGYHLKNTYLVKPL
ncbi:MAG: tRNA uridine(34) 5-carboxymethylaminomethyl modification radical SAM/GNAT enzyme Elp3 [Patescibacteria group bacterium]